MPWQIDVCVQCHAFTASDRLHKRYRQPLRTLQ